MTKIEVTQEMRERVQKLAGYGLTHIQIAHCLNMSRPTLVKLFRDELDRGKSLAAEEVLDALFYNIKKKDVASIFFWLKTQLKWREKADKQEDELPKRENITFNVMLKPEK